MHPHPLGPRWLRRAKNFRYPFLIACAVLTIAPYAQAHPGHGTNVPEGLLGGDEDAKPEDDDQFKLVAPRTPDLSKERTLYVVGYSHLDTQWRWTYPQVIRQFIPETMQRNFTLFDKYPNYIFNFSGSRRYEMMREYFPADYQRVKAYITAGRWFPCGSSVDEGDSIVPSLESNLRHILYGNQYFRREFGIESREFMLPDCFGFPAGLPTIISHAGLRGFSTQKLTWGSANGIPFKVGNWIGPDGSSIIAALDPGAYTGSVREDLSKSKYWIDRIEANGQKSQVFTDYHYYGAGDRGGAPTEDSVHWVEHSVASDGALKVVSSRADQMFNDITDTQRPRLPNYTGELLLTEHSAGAITSEAYMKRWNRKSELLADAAERASVAAMWMGGTPYPAKKLRDSWDLVLGSQMHDMLPGTSLPKAYEYCWNDYTLAQNGLAAATQNGVASVASAMDTRVRGVALAVYNPLGIAREDCVEATVNFAKAAPQNIEVFGPDGKRVPSQILSRNGNSLKIVFLGRVPSVGLAVFDVRGASASPVATSLKITSNSLENERFTVRINANGDVASVFDKQAKKEILASPARLAFMTERPKQYPAWNMDWKDRKNPPRAYVSGPAKVRIVENGPVRIALEIERFSEGSRFVQTLRLATGEAGNKLDFDTKIDWQTTDSSLKAVFPLTVSNPTATYDAQVGVVTRGNNDPKKYEVPQHQWFDLTSTDSRYGASVYNDSKYGSDKPSDNTLRLTLLYTPNADSQYQDQGTQDIGHHQMLYSLAPHRGDWRTGQAHWGAARVNQPLLAFQTPSHAGTLGKTFSLLRISTPQVAITSIKKAEESNQIVVRLRELAGSQAKGLRLVAASPIVAAHEVDGQERTIGPASLISGALLTSVRPYGLRAFALTLGAPKTKIAPVQSQPVALPYNLDAVSFDRARTNGRFDSVGRTLAAEELPTRIESEGIAFQTGPKSDGAKNAVTCQGQKITLPTGNWDRVYVLAASVGGARKGRFTVGSRATTQEVADWGGYLGSWDLRTWNGKQPELTYNWPLKITGLIPGYIKRDVVAWQCSHRHHPQAGNEYYERSYLFKYGFDVMPGTRTLTLPNDPTIRVFAVSVARNSNARVVPAQPLYDTLQNDVPQTPTIEALAPRVPGDAIRVAIRHPLYGNWTNSLRYTLDGSEPTAQSPVYTEPFFVNGNVTVKTRQLGTTSSPIASATFTIDDSVAPVMETVIGNTLVPEMRVQFSEPLEATSATRAENYTLRGAAAPTVVSSTLESPNTVVLKLSAPVSTTSDTTLSVTGVRDRSARGNAIAPATTHAVELLKPVVAPANALTFTGTGNGFSQNEAKLPTDAKVPWTINQWVYLEQQPEELTILGGFGSARDEESSQRFLVKYHDRIHFWGGGIDITASAPYDLNRWQMITLTYDGSTVRIYKDGKEIGRGAAAFSEAQAVAKVAPAPAWREGHRLTGKIAKFEIYNGALSPEAVTALLAKTP